MKENIKNQKVTILEGPRGVGKTTLANKIIEESNHSWLRFNLQELNKSELEEFQYNLKTYSVESKFIFINEAQLIKDLPLTIKSIVDNSNTKFLLTGSSPLRRDQLGGSNPLTGRAVIIPILPFTQNELNESSKSIEKTLTNPKNNFEQITIPKLSELIFKGGIPILNSISENIFSFSVLQYIENVLAYTFDDTKVSINRLNNTYKYIASNTGLEINLSNLSHETGIDRKQISSYITLIENRYLIKRLDRYIPNRKATSYLAHPKLYSTDTALSCALLNIIEPKNLIDNKYFGHIFETFVINEITNQLTNTGRSYTFNYWKNKQNEVDLVITTPTGKTIGVEIKGKKSIRNADYRGLTELDKEYGLDSGMIVFFGSNNDLDCFPHPKWKLVSINSLFN